MQKTHCEHCDRAIPATEKRWTLRVGVAKGDRSKEDDDPRDFCAKCFRTDGTRILDAIRTEGGWTI